MLLKNLFDKIISLFGIIILLPLLIIIAIIIRIKMPDGPILFKQERVGLYGKLFTLYKFRTMYSNHGGNSISVAGEPRITTIGAFLRKYKLDELPELWNVLIGNMSIVGPRPDVPGFSDKLTGEKRKILLMKPGITGPASLKYANEEKILAKVADPIKYNEEVIFPDKVRINIDYYNNYSFILDLKIFIKTLIRKNY